jgi:hypothetical protein
MASKVEKGLSELVGTFTDPIIVCPGGWGDSLPDWLKEAITTERLMTNMKSLKGEEATATDAECCAYLYTASLSTPLDNDWTQIYLYIATKSYEQWNKSKMPDEVAVNSLNDYQLMNLNRLRKWIYQTRCKARRNNERRRQEKIKEGEISSRKEEPVTLFDF